MFLISTELKERIEGTARCHQGKGEVVNLPLLENVDQEQLSYLEGGVYDLRIDRLYEPDLYREAFIGVERRITSTIKEVEATPNQYRNNGDIIEYTGWILEPNRPYLVSTKEKINLGVWHKALIEPKTTLFRCFLGFQKSWVHPNYQGQLTFLVYNHLPIECHLEQGAMIASLSVVYLGKAEPAYYDGQWQNGEVSSNGEMIPAK